jgi:ketosteroid isomerase-like protein
MGRNKDIYNEVIAAVGSGDYEKIRKYIADDFVLTESDALPYPGEFVGPDGFVKLSTTLRSLFEVDIVSSSINEAENNILLCEFVFGFKSLRTGERVEMPVVEVFRFNSEGKVVRGDMYYLDAAKIGALA